MLGFRHKVTLDAKEWKIPVERMGHVDGEFDVKWKLTQDSVPILEGSLHFDDKETRKSIRIVNDFDIDLESEPFLIELYDPTNGYLVGHDYIGEILFEACCTTLSLNLQPAVAVYQGLVLYHFKTDFSRD